MNDREAHKILDSAGHFTMIDLPRALFTDAGTSEENACVKLDVLSELHALLCEHAERVRNVRDDISTVVDMVKQRAQDQLQRIYQSERILLALMGKWQA